MRDALAELAELVGATRAELAREVAKLARAAWKRELARTRRRQRELHDDDTEDDELDREGL